MNKTKNLKKLTKSKKKKRSLVFSMNFSINKEVTWMMSMFMADVRYNFTFFFFKAKS